jgi:DNA-directed RNA polymerase subunit RPC12/RpoP
MGRIKLEIDGYICDRCNHEWVRRGKGHPIVCPHCKSPYWDRPRQLTIPKKPVLLDDLRTIK